MLFLKFSNREEDYFLRKRKHTGLLKLFTSASPINILQNSLSHPKCRTASGTMDVSCPMVPTQAHRFIEIKWFGLEGTLKDISFPLSCHGQGHLPSSAHIWSFPCVVEGNEFTAHVSRKWTINVILDQNWTIKEKKIICAQFVIFRACSFAGSNCSLI